MLKSDIEKVLRDHFSPLYLHIVDQSQAHANHYQSDSPEDTHLSLTVVSNHWVDVSRVQRHRQVYALLEQAFQKRLHALQLQLLTEVEAKDRLPAFQ